MVKTIKRVGVIGAGVMGSTIAAHLANVGLEVVLLDIVPPGGLTDGDKKNGLTEESKEFRNRLAEAGLQAALKAKPASFYIKDSKKLITLGNLEDNLDWLTKVDWIVEVVIENLKIKRLVFEKIESVMTPDTIVTSNTSGISAAAMCEGRSTQFQENFAVTHFFNPPRYMKLLELVPGPNTSKGVIDALVDTCERVLGKGIVYAKDTPNFVANRIGVFSMFSGIRAMLELKLSVEAVDKLTGPVIGHPKSASFRTADLVGLDTLVHVANNTYDGVEGDEQREMFKPPEFINKMVEAKLLGEKTKQGFYQKSKDDKGKRVILSIDPSTLQYGPQEKVTLKGLEGASNAGKVPKKIKFLYYAKDVAGEFTFKTLSETLIYSANRIPEIADDIVNVDNGMKWGFAWKLGPFEIWDAIGLKRSTEAMTKAGLEIPAWVSEMLAGDCESFYKEEDGKRLFYDVETKGYKEIAQKPGVVLLPILKATGGKVEGNSGATLVDLGDGVACLEFHTKMNAMGEDIVRMVNKSCDIIEKNFEGLVIANHGTNFSVGANLPLVLFTAQEEEWDDLDYMIRIFQDAFMRLKYLSKPVVAAPAGMALGGGCEMCLHSDRVRFAGETYMGLVEVGVGLLPAGGGTKEMLLRSIENLFEVKRGGIYPKQIDTMPFIARAFETIAMAKVSTSGPEALEIGYLRPTDRMTVNRDYLIDDAKKTVLALNLEGYAPSRPSDDIRVAGENTFAVLKLALWTMRKAGYITDHDITVSEKIANVLCGGRVLEGTVVSEQYLLDLEREAFLSLAGEFKTQARIQHMLTKGKPLRN